MTSRLPIQVLGNNHYMKCPNLIIGSVSQSIMIKYLRLTLGCAIGVVVHLSTAIMLLQIELLETFEEIGERYPVLCAQKVNRFVDHVCNKQCRT